MSKRPSSDVEQPPAKVAKADAREAGESKTYSFDQARLVLVDELLAIVFEHTKAPHILKEVCKEWASLVKVNTEPKPIPLSSVTTSVPLLAWARDRGCPWDERTCAYAAKGGHLVVLEWARASGCPWDERTCAYAAEGGHLEVLKWGRAKFKYRIPVGRAISFT